MHKFLKKRFWRDIATDQLDFGLGGKLSPDTIDIGLCNRFTFRDRQIHWNFGWIFYHVKKKVEVCIKMCDVNGKPFIKTIYNVLLVLDLCDSFFSIITLMNLVHTCIFRGGFCVVLFSDNQHNVMTLPHGVHRNIYFWLFFNSESKITIPKRKLICNYCTIY